MEGMDIIKKLAMEITDKIIADNFAPEDTRFAALSCKVQGEALSPRTYCDDKTINQDAFKAANEKLIEAIKLFKEAKAILETKPIEVSAETYERWEFGR